MIFLYPETSRFFFQNTWQSFLEVCFISFSLAFVTIVLSHFPILQYYSKLDNRKYVSNPRKEMGKLIDYFRQNLKQLRRRFPSIMILILLAVAAAAVPADIFFGLFTPSYRNDGESFSHSYFFVSDTIYLFIYSTRIASNLIQSDYRFYRLSQTEYTIYPAKLPLLSLVRIPDPIHVTSGSARDPSIDATSSEFSQTNLGYLSVNVSRCLNYSYVPRIDNFTDVEFDVSGISDPSYRQL